MLSISTWQFLLKQFFKNIERQWRKELFNIADANNFIFVFTLLIMDYFARCIADIKIKFSRNPHLWKPVTSLILVFVKNTTT